MLASYLVDANRSSQALEPIALEQLGYKALTEDEVRGKGVKAIAFAQVPVDSVLDYAGERADLALQLSERVRAGARSTTSSNRCIAISSCRWCRSSRRSNAPACASTCGRWRRSRCVLDREMTDLSRQIFALAGGEFNIGSPKQLAEILFEKLQLPVLKRTGTSRAPSTAVEVLEELAAQHDICRFDPRLARPVEAEGHLHRRAADAGQSGNRPRAHADQPGGRGDRPPEQQRSQPAEHPDPHRDRPPDSQRLHRRSGPRADLGRLLADRAARAGAPVRRRNADRGLRARRRHSRSDGEQGVRRRQHARSARAAAAREDHQLRAALRQDRVHAGEGHRRDAAGGAAVHRRLLRRLPARARVHRQDARRRAGQRRREDDVRPAAAGAGADQPELPDSRRRRAHRGEHADPGHRRRHPQARDDRRPRGAGRRRIRRRG